MAVSANTRKGGWLETATIVIEALAIAMVVRTFLYQPFNIPSGSMKETLLVGDYLFVSKLSYGYSRYSFYNFIPFDGPHLRRRAQARRRRRVQAAARQLDRLHQARHRACRATRSTCAPACCSSTARKCRASASATSSPRRTPVPPRPIPGLRGNAAQRREVHRARRRGERPVRQRRPLQGARPGTIS